MQLVVRREGNRFVVERCDYSEFTICLNDDMVNLDKPVTVEYGGKTLFQGNVKRSAATIGRTIRERRDMRLVFSAEVGVRIPVAK